MSEMPGLQPIWLKGLPFRDAMHQLRSIGCALRREHWPPGYQVAIRGGKIMLLGEGPVARSFSPGRRDRVANDWEMVQDPAGRLELAAMISQTYSEDEA